MPDVCPYFGTTTYGAYLCPYWLGMPPLRFIYIGV